MNRISAFRVVTTLLSVLSVFSAGAQSNADNPVAKSEAMAVSYTHLTLPTILLV